MSVILFFVLSGYVLAIPFLKKSWPPYSAYIIKRVCRIYIPFAVAIVCAAILYAHSSVPRTDNGSIWWGEAPVTLQTILDHLSMRGRFSDIWLDGVMWSLIVEMRVSIIFPVLVLLCKSVRFAALFALATYVIVTIAIVFTGHDDSYIMSDSIAVSLLLTLRYVPLFMLGIVLAKKNDVIKDWFGRLSRTKFIVLLGLTLFVLCLPTDIRSHPDFERILSELFGRGADAVVTFCVDLCLGLASGFLIVWVRNNHRHKSILDLRMIQWLGNISYSLYLVHLPIAIFLFRKLYGIFPLVGICCLIVGSSLMVASLFFLTIERPSIYIGKALTAKRQNA